MESCDISHFYKWGKKIVGVGLNYKETAQQIGESLPAEPVLFFKPTTSYITEDKQILISEQNKRGLLYEVELGIVMGRKCKRVAEADVLDYIGGYCVVLDMTCPESFFQARDKVLPWCIAKGFDTSTPVGPFVSKNAVPEPQNLNLWLKLNGQMKQMANTKDMNFSIPEMISFISHHFTLEAGDLVITGTPGGVGHAVAGDKIEAGIDKIGKISFEVHQEASHSQKQHFVIFP